MIASGSEPVVEGLFTSQDGQIYLLGTRCDSCGSRYFPQAVSCRNPRCRDKAISPALLGPTGRLYSWTWQGYRPPPPFQMDDWSPFAIGLVALDEGLRVLGMLDVPRDSIEIGMPLRLAPLRLTTNAEGQAVHTYCFTQYAGPYHDQTAEPA